jgi:hypothetical protein
MASEKIPNETNETDTIIVGLIQEITKLEKSINEKIEYIDDIDRTSMHDSTQEIDEYNINLRNMIQLLDKKNVELNKMIAIKNEENKIIEAEIRKELGKYVIYDLSKICIEYKNEKNLMHEWLYETTEQINYLSSFVSKKALMSIYIKQYFIKCIINKSTMNYNMDMNDNIDSYAQHFNGQFSQYNRILCQIESNIISNSESDLRYNLYDDDGKNWIQFINSCNYCVKYEPPKLEDVQKSNDKYALQREQRKNNKVFTQWIIQELVQKYMIEKEIVNIWKDIKNKYEYDQYYKKHYIYNPELVVKLVKIYKLYYVCIDFINELIEEINMPFANYAKI